MGKFTVYEEPWIDEEIQCQLDTIIKIIKSNVPTVRSIILYGGFGRGEGSVRVVGTKVVPLKDYDIAVVVDKKPNHRVVQALNDEVYTKLKMPNPDETDFHFLNFAVDIGFTRRKYLGMFPDIGTYDRKVASNLLFGEEVRSLIPWKVGDIPLSSGLRFLFEKMTGLIGNFSQEYLLGTEIEEYNRRLLIYECYKTYVEIATALCLLMKCYEPSYRERMELFKNNFERELPDLYEKIPDLPEWVTKTTKFKLRPDFESVKEDPIDLWFHTRDVLCTVLEYYLEDFLDTKINNWTNSYEETCALMGRRYHKSLMEKIVSVKMNFKSEYLSSLLTLFLQIYLSYRSTHQLLKEHGILRLKFLTHPRIPITNMTYLTTPIVLFSIKRDGKIDETYFEEAKKRLDYLFPIKEMDENSPWDTLRETYLKAYYLYGWFR